MGHRNFNSSIVLLGIAIAIFVETRKLPIGSFRAPQMGFFPFILGIMLTIFSLLLLWQTIKEKGRGRSHTSVRSGNWKGIGLTLGALFAYAFLLECLGYILSTFLLIVFLLRVIGAQKWWVVISGALLSSLASFLIFDLLLDVPLPAGILGS